MSEKVAVVTGARTLAAREEEVLPCALDAEACQR
jgi:hypothetical protein